MLCPACKDVTLTMTHRQDVEIDYCPQCRGVWLDRGELDKIIDRSASETSAPPPSRDYSRDHSRDRRYDDDRRDYYYKKKKKKSFLSEIFDFD